MSAVVLGDRMPLFTTGAFFTLSFQRFSLSSALNALLLTLLLWSAVLPAHLKKSTTGHWTELCTTTGFKTVWVSDQMRTPASDADQATSFAAGAMETAGTIEATHLPAHNGHAKPHCPWCLFSLPALAILVLCAFFTPRLSHIIPSVNAQPFRATTTLWHWACPRAPPKLHLSAI